MKDFDTILSKYTDDVIELDKTCAECGIDSLDVSALIIDLEEYYNINILDDEIEKLTDIQSLYDLVQFKVNTSFKLHQRVVNKLTDEAYVITSIHGNSYVATRYVTIKQNDINDWIAWKDYQDLGDGCTGK